MTIQVNRPVDFKLAAYFLDWDSFTRAEEISFPGRAIDPLIMDDFNGGKWSQWDIHADPGNPLVMHVQNLTGANAVLSALMFDPIPEPGTCGLALAALVAACLVALKRARSASRWV